MNYANSAELREQIRATWDGVGLVSFSCGKDALCTWLAMRESGFREVHAVYLYLVPDLEFVEESIQLYEKRFGTKIHRLPHPSFCRLMRERVFQPPERWRPVGKLNLPNLTYDDVEMAARHAAGIDRRVPVAHGSRAADSLNRRTAVKRFGAVNKNRNTYWAIYDWTIADVRSCLARHNMPLPVDYELFGRSFDGIDYRFLEPIRRRFPRDYARILEWFPLADAELHRRSLCPQIQPAPSP